MFLTTQAAGEGGGELQNEEDPTARTSTMDGTNERQLAAPPVLLSYLPTGRRGHRVGAKGDLRRLPRIIHSDSVNFVGGAALDLRREIHCPLQRGSTPNMD